MKKDVFDELIVVKRSGQRVNFNNYKVAVAIKNAFDSFDDKYDESDINSIYEDVLTFIETNYVSRKTINVEDIQDIIEQKLKLKKYFDVYEEFSQYRQWRDESRQTFKVKQQHKFVKAMEKIMEENLLDPEMLYKPEEILLGYGGIVLDEFVKSYCIDNKYLRMHDEGNIYIPNFTNASLGRVAHTNLIIDDYLTEDFDVNLLANYLIDAKDEINGEIHISNFDKSLSNCAFRRLKKILIINVTRYLKLYGFDNYINFETLNNVINNSSVSDISDNLRKLALNDTVSNIFSSAYNDAIEDLKCEYCDKLLVLINKLNSSKKYYSFSFGGSNKYEVSFITDLIFSILKDNNHFEFVSFIYKVYSLDDVNLNRLYDLIEGNKNVMIQNIINTQNTDIEYFSSGLKIYDNYNDKCYSDGRMVVSEVSINMARIGMLCKDQSIEKFYDKVSETLDLAKNELLLMFETIGNKLRDNYKILFDNNIVYDEKLESGGKIRKVIKNSNLLIGLVGLKECISSLEEDPEKQYKLITNILNFINDKCSKYRDETKLNFYVYEPSNIKPRKYFMALDKAIYGSIKDITDKESYDYICDLKILNEDYDKMGEICKLLPCGNIILREIKNNISYKKFMFLINEFANTNIEFVKFNRR